jgi:hypothetical protein
VQLAQGLQVQKHGIAATILDEGFFRAGHVEVVHALEDVDHEPAMPVLVTGQWM